MSNIYIQEPPTSGKVLLKTSIGDIDIELWCREAPKTCRNFIQLCMEGYYNSTIFHRIVKGFIAQGGDPQGDGLGGESIYGAPFKDEFHSRLRFVRRGLVAMANAGRDDNGSQFFFTLGETMELQDKHTIFGKVTGDTVFNMLKLEEGEIDHNERPFYPHRIISSEILLNPFDDIVPRVLKSAQTKERKQKREKGVKNFGLLSFGAEAAEDEEETTVFVRKTVGKPKSTHDTSETKSNSKSRKENNELDDRGEISSEYKKERVNERVRNKLKTSRSNVEPEKPDKVSDSDSDSLGNELEKERSVKRQKKVDEIRNEISSLKRNYQKNKKEKIIEIEKNEKTKLETTTTTSQQSIQTPMSNYISEQEKYNCLKKDMQKKGSIREQHTLALLSKFKNKLRKAKEETMDDDEDDDDDQGKDKKKISTAVKLPILASNDERNDDIVGDDWLLHTLRFEETAPVLAKDASTKKDDWYDAFDPRNPLNKRKRGDDDRRH